MFELPNFFPLRFWFVILFVGGWATSAWSADIRGERAKWHPIELDFQGPLASESDLQPNPFLDYRLSVDFIAPSGAVTRVPGFFAGDGQGNGRGTIWRARFSADETGQWRYRATLSRGSEVAISLDPAAGSSMPIEGASGEFTIAPSPDNSPQFLKYGRLEHVGQHYMKFRDGPYWIKGGTDSPENLLGFAGIDGTQDNGGPNGYFLHNYAAHVNDWKPNDPLFSHATTGADSRGLIGALNYLGQQGVNSVYFLPMNLGGDGQDTYPFTGPNNTRFDKTHYDISKLHQWNAVLNHAQRQGIALNIVLSETEEANERWLDNGALGVERKLFFRELVARFGYLLAVKWNLGEENDFTLIELQKHADYLQAIDWSRKPIAVHTHINQFYRYGELVGDKRFSASSIQYDAQFAGQFVEQWRSNSANAGHRWVVDMDENTNGLGSDNTDERRKEILYDVLFSGGNIEWYFGYLSLPVGGDIDAGNFRYRENMWRQMRLAREMMQNELPFWRMNPADDRVVGDSDAYGGAEAYVLEGESYAVYLPAANGTEVLKMGRASGNFKQRWFDPRTGQMIEARQSIAEAGPWSLGSPPSGLGQDWVALVTRTDPSSIDQPTVTSNTAPRFDFVPSPTVSVGQRFFLILTAVDNDGTYPAVTVGNLPAGMRIRGPGNGKLELSWTVPASAARLSPVELIAIDAIDNSLRTTQVMTITVEGELMSDNTQPNSPNDAVPTANPTGAPGSSVPIFRPIQRQVAKVGSVLAIRVQADDADGIPPALIILNKPQHSSFEDNGDGTRTFYWQPRPEQVGDHTIIFVARDHVRPSLTDTLNVEIRVTP